jgi:HAD superfamily hydrolase (TIGR01509 family)
MPLNALLFDLDGTLANTDPIHFENWREIMLGYGMEIDQEFYDAQFSGRRNLEIVEEHLPQLSAEEGLQLSEYKEAQFREQATRLPPLAGLAKILDWSQRHSLKQAVVTNAPRVNAEFMLQVLGLIETFPTVILGEELPIGKPDPLPYQLALKTLDVLAAEAIAFEDSPSGVRSAVGAGILTVGMATSQTPELLYELGATLVVNDFADLRLWELLEKLRSNPKPVSEIPMS